MFSSWLAEMPKRLISLGAAFLAKEKVMAAVKAKTMKTIGKSDFIRGILTYDWLLVNCYGIYCFASGGMIGLCPIAIDSGGDKCNNVEYGKNP